MITNIVSSTNYVGLLLIETSYSFPHIQITYVCLISFRVKLKYSTFGFSIKFQHITALNIKRLNSIREILI